MTATRTRGEPLALEYESQGIKQASALHAYTKWSHLAPSIFCKCLLSNSHVTYEQLVTKSYNMSVCVVHTLSSFHAPRSFSVVHPVAVEIPRSMSMVATNWNLPMHKFLKNCEQEGKHMQPGYDIMSSFRCVQAISSLSWSVWCCSSHILYQCTVTCECPTIDNNHPREPLLYNYFTYLLKILYNNLLQFRSIVAMCLINCQPLL